MENFLAEGAKDKQDPTLLKKEDTPKGIFTPLSSRFSPDSSKMPPINIENTEMLGRNTIGASTTMNAHILRDSEGQLNIGVFGEKSQETGQAVLGANATTIIKKGPISVSNSTKIGFIKNPDIGQINTISNTTGLAYNENGKEIHANATIAPSQKPFFNLGGSLPVNEHTILKVEHNINTLFNDSNTQLGIDFYPTRKTEIHGSATLYPDMKPDLNFGGSYNPAENMKFNADYTKNSLIGKALTLGAEYIPVKGMRINAGYSTGDNGYTFTTGIGTENKNLNTGLFLARVETGVDIGTKVNYRGVDISVAQILKNPAFSLGFNCRF